MKIHQNDNNSNLDILYINGSVEFLVKGNICRYKDGRRTEGYIEEIFIDKGCFRWCITKYEDEGEFWDVNIEDVINFQFDKKSIMAIPEQIQSYNKCIDDYDKNMVIEIEEEKKKQASHEIKIVSEEIKKWLLNQVVSKEELLINFDSKMCNEKLTYLMQKYMKLIQCDEVESKTVKQLLLNPNSGEWFKGILISMAEMGLTNYNGKIVRDTSTFKGIGKKEIRKKYIIHRLAFMNAMFDLNLKKNLVLYRGMSSEKGWRNKKRSMIHMTFSKEVAEAFSDLDSSSKYINSYIMKMTLPVEQVFISYIETGILNEKYKEK